MLVASMTCTIGEARLNVIRVVLPAIANSPPKTGAETAFYSFWDSNIHRILELLVPEGQGIRINNRHTETRNLRPDFGFLFLSRTIYPFRGEEKGSQNAEDPRAELTTKLDWAYDPGPYMLGASLHSVRRHLMFFAGYYSRESHMTLTAPDIPGAGYVSLTLSASI